MFGVSSFCYLSNQSISMIGLVDVGCREDDRRVAGFLVACQPSGPSLMASLLDHPIISQDCEKVRNSIRTYCDG